MSCWFRLDFGSSSVSSSKLTATPGDTTTRRWSLGCVMMCRFYRFINGSSIFLMDTIMIYIYIYIYHAYFSHCFPYFHIFPMFPWWQSWQKSWKSKWRNVDLLKHLPLSNVLSFKSFKNLRSCWCSLMNSLNSLMSWLIDVIIVLLAKV